MKNYPNIYLAIDNQILQRGFEDILKTQIPQAVVNQINDAKKLFEINFQKDTDTPKILIYDANLKNEQTNLLLFNLLQNNPCLRTIILINDFEKKKVKFLFDVGIYGVMTSKILPEDFMEMIHDVLQGKKCLSPILREQVIKQFCQKEVNISNGTTTKPLTDKEKNYGEQLFGLTKREREILCLICNGRNTKEISEELFISQHTAETHRRNLLYKLNVKNTAEMVKVAVTSRLVAV